MSQKEEVKQEAVVCVILGQRCVWPALDFETIQEQTHASAWVVYLCILQSYHDFSSSLLRAEVLSLLW